MLAKVGAAATKPQPVQSYGKLWNIPDDFSNLQEALDEAAPGDGVFLAPGVYEVTQPIVVQKPVHIMGVDDVGESAVLRFRTRENYLPLLRVTCSNVRIKGVKLDAVYVDARDATDSSHSVTKTPNSVVGLLPLDPGSPRWIAVTVAQGVHSVVFDECHIQASGMHGIFLAANSSCSFVCSMISCPQGCALFNDGRVSIDRCDITKSKVGVVISQNGHTTIKSSCCTECTEGVAVDGYGFVDVSTSVFANCGVGLSYHTELAPAKTSIVRGTEFVDCINAGILISGLEGCLDVEKNYFHGTSKAGVLLIDGVQKAKIVANAFKNISGWGVHVVGGSPVIESNVFEGCSGGGIKVNSNRPIIRLNEFVRNVNTLPGQATSSLRREGESSGSSSSSKKQKAPERSYSIFVDGSGVTHQTAESNARRLFDELSCVRRVVKLGNANAVRSQREAVVVSTDAVTNVLRSHPDPHVEGNLFAQNQVNVRVLLGGGVFVKNELLSSVEESVLVEGVEPPSSSESDSCQGGDDRNKASPYAPAVGGDSASPQRAGAATTSDEGDARLPVFPVSFTHNELRGSVSSHVVVAAPGAFANFSHNRISHAAKGYGILIDNARFVEVKHNVVSECQGGIQGRGRHAKGKVVSNDLQGLSLYVQLEAVNSIYCTLNKNSADADAQEV